MTNCAELNACVIVIKAKAMPMGGEMKSMMETIQAQLAEQNNHLLKNMQQQNMDTQKRFERSQDNFMKAYDTSMKRLEDRLDQRDKQIDDRFKELESRIDRVSPGGHGSSHGQARPSSAIAEAAA